MAAILPPPPDDGFKGQGPTGHERDPLPKRFGKYTLIRNLAAGGMAELFLAIQRSVAGFEKLVVIKRILPAMNRDTAFVEMLLHEARIAATLSHPNIVQVFDVGQVDGTYFIAMEHVHGEDLRTIVRQMKKKGIADFTIEHAVTVALGICARLGHAHDRRGLDGDPLCIVHRDVSPQNVVVTFTGDVKIVDFGIAKSGARVGGDTRSGKLKGKLPYMSPEQARGEEIDWRTDLFAAGVILFELTTGKRLFKAASEYETLKLICEGTYPRPSQVRADYPLALEQIVMRALAKERDARFQSAREMRVALEELVRAERIGASTMALSHFMESLFEEKLASQQDALVQGKHLADRLALEGALPPAEPEVQPNASSSNTASAPAAAHTIAARPRRNRRDASLLLVGALGLAAFGGTVVVARSQAVPGARETVAGSLRIETEPPGAAVWIQGNLRSEATPATITSLPLGASLDVKLTKDGYEPAVRSLTLSAARPAGHLAEALRVAPCTVDVRINPPTAQGILVLDGKEHAGAVIEQVVPNEPHDLVVRAPGYDEQSLRFVGKPFERKHFDVTLERARPSL